MKRKKLVHWITFVIIYSAHEGLLIIFYSLFSYLETGEASKMTWFFLSLLFLYSLFTSITLVRVYFKRWWNEETRKIKTWHTLLIVSALILPLILPRFILSLQGLTSLGINYEVGWISYPLVALFVPAFIALELLSSFMPWKEESKPDNKEID